MCTTVVSVCMQWCQHAVSAGRCTLAEWLPQNLWPTLCHGVSRPVCPSTSMETETVDWRDRRQEAPYCQQPQHVTWLWDRQETFSLSLFWSCCRWSTYRKKPLTKLASQQVSVVLFVETVGNCYTYWSTSLSYAFFWSYENCKYDSGHIN